MKKSNIFNMLLVAIVVVFSLNAIAGGHAQKEKPAPAASAGKAPKCPEMQEPKNEEGRWACRDKDFKVDRKQRSKPAVGKKPRCPKGQIAKMEDGMWLCRDLPSLENAKKKD